MGNGAGRARIRGGRLRLAAWAVLAALIVFCVAVPAALAWPEPVSEAPTVTVTGISPTSGAGGSTVTITGSGFAAAGINGVNNVGFDGSWAQFTIVSNTEITATVPADVGAGWSGPIEVESTDYTPTLDVVSTGDFTVLASPDPYNGVSPTSGPPGTLVTVSGTSLGSVNSVTFNGESVNFVAADSQLTTQIPTDAAPGSGTLTLISPGGQASLTFTVAPEPHINSILPTSGDVGTSFVINGSNLTNASQVTLNSSPVNFTVGSSQLTVTLPSWASTGQIAVTTPAGTATGPTFTVTAASTATTATTAGSTGTAPSSGSSSSGSGSSSSEGGSGSSSSSSSNDGSSGSGASGTGSGSASTKSPTASASASTASQGVSVSAPVVTDAGGGEQAVAFSVHLNATTSIHVVLTAPSGKRVLAFTTRAAAGRTHFIRDIPALNLKSGAPLTLRVSFTSHGKTHTTSLKLHA